MKEIGINELKKLQLDILIKIRNFCDSHGISYYLAYGTLLGAVRHKGYIPWDDDIDIMMPRNDYNRFLQEFNGQYKDLVVHAPELDLSYYAPYANVMDNRTLLCEPHLKHEGIGVKIDIFPIDNVPDEYILYQNVCRKSGKLNRIREAKVADLNYYNGLSWLKLFIKKVLFFFISYPVIQKRIIELATNCDPAVGNYVDCIVFITIKNRRFPRTCVEGYELVNFENEKFKAPKDYDVCLKALFGDYMKMPPKEKRVAHHNFKAYWL